jgi:hypothetical protein
VPEDILKPQKQPNEAGSAPPLDSAVDATAPTDDSEPKKIEVNNFSDETEKVNEAQSDASQEEEPVVETPKATESTQAELQETPTDSVGEEVSTQQLHTEPTQSPETSSEELAPKKEEDQDSQNEHVSSDQQAPPEPHKTHHVPVVAVTLAVIVCALLIGAVVYLTMNGDDEAAPVNQTQSQQNQPETSAQNDKSEVDGAITEAGQLPASEDPTSGISDQSLGL